MFSKQISSFKKPCGNIHRAFFIAVIRTLTAKSLDAIRAIERGTFPQSQKKILDFPHAPNGRHPGRLRFAHH